MTASILDESSWTTFADGSLDTFARLLVLDFFLSSIYLRGVDFHGDLSYPQFLKKERLKFSLTSNPHLQVPLGLFEPRISAKRKQAFQEIEDAEGILRSVNNLVDSIEFVIAALKPDNIAETQEPARRKRERHMQELDGLCKERHKNAEGALDALNRQLDYLTKRYSIHEADRIKRLTILASIYLTLSLTAALLGMQTPFRAVAHNHTQETQDLDGTNLLFDFLGVFIILASATIFHSTNIQARALAQVSWVGIRVEEIQRSVFDLLLREEVEIWQTRRQDLRHSPYPHGLVAGCWPPHLPLGNIYHRHAEERSGRMGLGVATFHSILCGRRGLRDSLHRSLLVLVPKEISSLLNVLLSTTVRILINQSNLFVFINTSKYNQKSFRARAWP